MPKDCVDEEQRMEQMRRWLMTIADCFDLDVAVVSKHEGTLLSLVSTIAHGPSRPGAPMTAFVVGYVAGSTGRDVEEISRVIEAVAQDWS